MAIDLLRVHIGPEDAVIVAGAGLPTIPLADCAEWLDSRGLGPAEVWHEALDRFPDAEAGAIIPPNVRFAEGSMEVLVGALDGRTDAVAVYCDYMHVKGSDEGSGSVRQVTLLDHDNCLHERFDFGPFLLYDLRAVRRVGGFHRELKHGWEYDMHMRLSELGRFLRVPTPLYTFFTGNGTSSSGTALFSPGLGPLGGFSYVFYPPEMESEITGVFEDALRRRHALLDLPLQEVAYAEEREPVLCSVVIPVLNRERFIENAISKVLRGTFRNFEVIVVDNGSADGTCGVVEGIAAKDDRVRLIHGTGGTIASALNEGIRAARGRFICQLDSDDEYAPTTLEKMVAAFEADPTCGLAISYYRLMDEAGDPIKDVDPVTHTGYSRNQILRREGAGALRVFPKCVLMEFGLYDEVNCANFGEDYDMVLKVSEKYNVVRVPEVLYFYRRHDDNTDITRGAAMKYRNKNRARQEAMRRRQAMVLAARDAQQRNILPEPVPQDA